MIVDEFDYSTVKTSVQAVFNTQADIGKGIRAMLVKRMADANKVVIVERAKIDQLTSEQDRNASNRVKQGSGARVGRISGADAVLAGDIVVFGRRRQEDRRSAPADSPGGPPLQLGIHVKKEEDKAVKSTDYQVGGCRDLGSDRHWRSTRRERPQEQRFWRHGRQLGWRGRRRN